MQQKTPTIESRLRHAMNAKDIVQFSRPFEPGTFTGYVLDISKKFFLLAVLGDGLEFKHYTCLRVTHVRGLEAPAKREVFYKKVRRIRGDKLPRRIKVDLTDACSILRTLHPSIVTIHRERVSPDTCIIGVTTSDNGTYFEFLEIDPMAKWETGPTYHRLNQITRIDLPGPYEQALLLAGGEPVVRF